MKTSSAGLLLLLVGVIGLSAYVSGNLPGLLAYLFGAPAAPAAPAAAPTSGPAASRVPVVLANRRTA